MSAAGLECRGSGALALLSVVLEMMRTTWQCLQTILAFIHPRGENEIIYFGKKKFSSKMHIINFTILSILGWAGQLGDKLPPLEWTRIHPGLG